MRASRLTVGLLATTLLLAGCGTTTKKATQAKSADSPSPSPAASASADTPTDPAPGLGGDFCKVVKSEIAGLKAVFPKDMTDAKQLRVYGQYVKTNNARIRAVAPAEIRGDIDAISKVSNAVADAYLAGKQPPLSVLQSVRDPKFLAAAKHLGAYAKSQCGINASANPLG